MSETYPVMGNNTPKKSPHTPSHSSRTLCSVVYKEILSGGLDPANLIIIVYLCFYFPSGLRPEPAPTERFRRLTRLFMNFSRRRNRNIQTPRPQGSSSHSFPLFSFVLPKILLDFYLFVVWSTQELAFKHQKMENTIVL